MTAIATHRAEIEELFAELDYRESNGIEVSLLWDRAENRLTVVACDSRTNESFEIAVDPSHAREVFLHPYAYAA